MGIDLETGEDAPEEKGGAAKRGPGRPRKSEQLGDLEKDIREQLQELGEWIKARDPEFAETFLEDTAKMATFLAARAGKHERVARALRVVFAKDGPLAGLRAFGRTARKLLGAVAARRAQEEADGGLWVDEHGNQRDATGAIVVPHA